MAVRNSARRSGFSFSMYLFLAAASSLCSQIPGNAMAVETAIIRLPDDFAAEALRVEFTGFGGHNRGHYAGAGFTGEFTRSESRLGVFDPLFVASRARSSFTVEDLPGLAGLSADCRAAQNVANVSIVTLDPKKFVYQCEYTGIAQARDWRLVVGRPKRDSLKEKLIARERRRGEARLLDQEILIESVHDYDGSPLTSQTPLGYLLESHGVVIAAVDLLDWNPKVHLRDGLEESARLAAVVVALSLAVLRDPANSALED